MPIAPNRIGETVHCPKCGPIIVEDCDVLGADDDCVFCPICNQEIEYLTEVPIVISNNGTPIYQGTELR